MIASRSIFSLPPSPEPVGGLASLLRTSDPGSDTKSYIRLDRNERVSPLPEWFIEEIRKAVDSALLMDYPAQDVLHKRIAKRFHLPEDQLILTSGSEGAIRSLFQAYVRPGDGVVALDPSYAMYAVYAQMYQARFIRVPFDKEMQPDTSLLFESVRRGARLVLVANPNQPTGTLLDQASLNNLLEIASQTGTLVAVDEAYYPFSGTTVLPMLAKNPNLVMLRTFSKAAGMAGVRLGYAVGHRRVIENLFKVRPANGINAMAILCGEKLLNHPNIEDDYVRDVLAGGEVLTRRTRALGLAPFPVTANFILVRVGHVCPPGTLVEALKRRGYLVKGPFTAVCIEDCIRVTLGPPEMMEKFATVLGQALEEVN